MPKLQAIKEIITLLKEKKLSKDKLSQFKLKICKKYKIREVPTDIEILLHSSPEDAQKINLVFKPGRSASGVSVVAIMSYPFACRHGKCLYCPGGPGSVFGDIPQSYTGREPATMRAIRNKFDSYLQVFNRLEQYIAAGHLPEKIELIIMGGTFPSFNKQYQRDFVTYALKAMNDFGDLFFKNNKFDFKKYKDFFEMPGNMKDKARVERIISRVSRLKGKSNLKKEQLRNEKAKVRCVAMCLETRPDFCMKKELNSMLSLGTTRIELGVQTLNNEILKKIKRGHSVEDTIKATQLMKDCFLKVGYHQMPGLPNVSYQEDVNTFKKLFQDSNFRPDALKIYPCMVIEGTELYNLWKKKKYIPLTTKKAAQMMVSIKKYIPKYVRIMRVQRDIPTFMTAAGVDRTNLRQYVSLLLKKKGQECQCIRCREPRNRKIDFKNVKLMNYYYEASKGAEVFISSEDVKNNILLGFCRLRIPYKPFRKEITKDSAGIRELHVYGETTKIGTKGKNVQHKGIGKKLMLEAERIAK
ncbi:tRNA uridine(34) 5-carboxymethylaminomethyl modification radical SAM/GNAT enzyme Elp3, partial [Candidatus Woesearchaeota archaeon]|nr:tRNA uridine(34) 5-carboxymethylaminomethyl modification radical SAM/GNAT enzyme Elp3 [Candidatus Woesearchaeota archaeon]